MELFGKEFWEVIGFKNGDEVVGVVEMGDEDFELCFVI